MSQAASRLPPSGIPEGQAFVIIKFHVMKPNGNMYLEEADCLIDSSILGLKEDLHRQLGPPDSQTWYYGSNVMLNDRRLMDYGIDGIDNTEIVVKLSNN